MQSGEVERVVQDDVDQQGTLPWVQAEERSPVHDMDREQFLLDLGLPDLVDLLDQGVVQRR